MTDTPRDQSPSSEEPDVTVGEAGPDGSASAGGPEGGQSAAPQAEGSEPVASQEAAGSAPSEAPAGSTGPDDNAPTVPLDEHQRLMAEYVNYKRRVDRDRADIQQRAIGDVLESLLPILDEIHLAREHGDLTEGTPFASISDKLEGGLGKYGLERFGAVGESFDPVFHEALMNAPWDDSNEALPKDATTTTIVTVLQPGYRTGDRVLRPARVAVADPN